MYPMIDKKNIKKHLIKMYISKTKSIYLQITACYSN